MACCRCCCGGVDCTEGQEGKCCCGGISGTCCQEGEYCCGGACSGEPCGCEQAYSVTASLGCAGLSITWVFGSLDNPITVSASVGEGKGWQFGWPTGTITSRPRYGEGCQLEDVIIYVDFFEDGVPVYRQFWSATGLENAYGAAQPLYDFSGEENLCEDTPTFTFNDSPLP